VSKVRSQQIIPNASRFGRNKKYNSGISEQLNRAFSDSDSTMRLHRVGGSLILPRSTNFETKKMTKKEQKREYHKEWYKRNREKELSKVKEYKKKNPEVRASWLKENGSKPKVRFDKAKSNTRTKTKKPWLLTFEQYDKIINNPCHYCQVDISSGRGSGLDRLDNSKGYEMGNVVPACKACNVARNTNFTHDEWIVGVRAIFEFRKKILGL
jgi:hypothetical protein